MLKKILFFVVAGLVLGITAMADETEKETSAIASAEKWLTIIDNGKYIKSWKESSEYFKRSVSQDQWEQALQAIRKPLGKPVSRKVMSASYTTSLPGAPDGEYVVIEFNTSFENKETGIETVIPRMDKDGIWRVTGYYIK